MDLDVLRQILNKLVILEHGQLAIQGDISELKEGLSGTNQRLDSLEAGLSETNQRLSNLEYDVSAIKTQQITDSQSIDIIIAEIGKINRGQKSHGQRLSNLEVLQN